MALMQTYEAEQEPPATHALVGHAELATQLPGQVTEPTIAELFALGIVTDVINPTSAMPTEVLRIIGNFAIELNGRSEELTSDQVFILNALLCSRGQRIVRRDIDNLGFRAGEKPTVHDRAYHTARRRLEQLALPEAGIILQVGGGATSGRTYHFNPRVMVEEARDDTSAVASAQNISITTVAERKALASAEKSPTQNTRKPRVRKLEGPSDAELDIIGIYLKSIGVVPLLTREQEVELAQAIEAGSAAQLVLDAGEELSVAQRRHLRRQVREAKDAFDQFVSANLRLVVSIAKKYTPSGVPLEDLIQEGNLGMMHAVEKFEWRKGFKFSTYSTWWIRQAITRGIAYQKRTVRLPVHVSDDVSSLHKARHRLRNLLGDDPTLEDLANELGTTVAKVEELILYDTPPESIDRRVSDEADSAQIGDFIASATATKDFDEAEALIHGDELRARLTAGGLSDRECEVLFMRHGIGCEPHTLEEVGRKFNLTRERIRQIEGIVYTKLRGSPTRRLDKEDWL